MNIKGENLSLLSSNYCHESFFLQVELIVGKNTLFLPGMSLAAVFPYYQYIFSLSFFIFLSFSLSALDPAAFDISTSAPSF